MDCWGVLGLEGPTNDLKAIKRAYAKKLRVTRPDDDPEGFMALRGALEDAQYAAQYYEFSGGDEPLHDDVTTAPTPENSFDETTALEDDGVGNLSSLAVVGDPESINVESNGVEFSELEQIIESVQALLGDTFGRTESAKWLEIFNDPRLEAIDTALDFEDHFRSYLLETFGYFEGDASRANQNLKRPLITSRIGTLIFNRMGWRDADGRPPYVQDQIHWLRADLDVINRDRPTAQVKADIEFADQHFTDEDEPYGFPTWGIAGVLFALYILGKFLSNAYSNGMY